MAFLDITEAVISRVSSKYVFLEISQISGMEDLQLYKKETPTQVFSYEICKIFKNIFFTENLRWLFLA